MKTNPQIIKANTINCASPLVSIDILAYNHEKYIAQAIDGALMQKTFFLTEIVICDDCSTDSTRDIILSYQKKHPENIILRFNDVNVGLRSTYFENKVACRGKYIAICEGDDYWTDQNKLQKQIDFLEANPDYSMCFHNAVELHEYPGHLTQSNIFKPLEERDYSGSEILLNWLIPTASVVFRNDISLDFRYIDDFQFYDIVLFLRLADKGKIRCFDETMCVYRRHPESITSKDLNYSLFVKHLIAIDKEFKLKYHKEVKAFIRSEYFKQLKIRYKQRSIGFVYFFFLSLWHNPRLIIKTINYKLFDKT